MRFTEEDYYIERLKTTKDIGLTTKVKKKAKQNYEKFKEELNLYKSCAFVNWQEWTALIKDSSTKSGVYIGDRPQKEKLPYVDHCCMYKDKVGKRYLIFHPYSVDEKPLNDFCKKRGLKVKIYDESLSWYYPDRTYLVIVDIEDEEKYKKYLKENIMNKRK